MSIGFYFDETRCVGCKACQVACKDRLDLQKAGARPRRVDTYESGTFPNAQLFHTALSCNHCDNPACVAVCPTGAMFKDEDGTVLHNDDTCIGCQSCVDACPYGAPQVAEEYDGLIIKCDSCKALRNAGMNPVCVDACAMRALDFGEMDDLAARHPGDLVRALSCLPGEEQTEPNLLIKPKQAALTNDYRMVTL